MKERPILFNGDMVRAILAGRKTQTRRVIYMRHVHDIDDTGSPMRKNRNGIWGKAPCPYGQPGDRLWVRERCKYEDIFYKGNDLREGCFRARIEYYADNSIIERDVDVEHWSCACEMNTDTWRPSIHMPRWASRITLEVTDVRVQRLQEISEGASRAEGIISYPYKWQSMDFPYPDIAYQPVEGSTYRYTSPKDAFKDLWASIKGTWDEKPWVWAVSFKEVAP